MKAFDPLQAVAGKIRRFFRMRRRTGLVLGAVVLVALAIIASVWLRHQWTRAQELRTALLEFRGATSGEALLDSPQGAAGLVAELDRMEEDVLALRGSLDPLAVAGAVLGWIPFIGDDLCAPPGLADRAALDIAAAGDVIKAGMDLREEFLNLGSVLFGDVRTDSTGGVEGRSDAAIDRLLGALSSLEEARRIADGIEPDGLRPSLKEAALLLESEEGRLETVARWGLDAAGLLGSLRAVTEVSAVLLDRDASPADSLSRFATDFDSDLRQLAEAARAAHGQASGLQEALPALLVSSSLAGDIQILVPALSGLALVAEGAATGLRGLEGALSVFDDTGAGILRDGRSLQMILALLAGASDSLREAVEALEIGSDSLHEARKASADRPSFAKGLDRLEDAIEQLVPVLQFAEAFGAVGPGLLGVNGTRRYLLLGQSADELRGTGGFVFGVWTVTLVNGELGDIEYFDVVELDDRSRLHTYPQPPPGLENHMSAPVWLMRDVSWDPDFPATAQMAQHLFEIGQGQHVDGVVALNQWAMQHILEPLGSIVVEFDGTVVDVVNFIDVLEEGTDSHGRAYADAVFRAMLDAFSAELSASVFLKLAAGVQQMLDEGGLLVYSNDPDEQSTLRGLGWDGAVEQDANDYLMIVDSNVGWNKVDRNIERALSYEVSLTAPDEVTGRLTLSYLNLSDPTAACGSQWERAEEWRSYDELKNACYWDYVRVYVPGLAAYSGGDPMPLPAGSIYESIGRATVGDRTLTPGASHGKTVYSGLFALPGGASREVNLEYHLPPGTTRQDGDSLHYELLLQAQPGARSRDVAVTVGCPPGYTVSRTSGPPATVTDRSVDFRFDLTEDTRIEIEFAREFAVPFG